MTNALGLLAPQYACPSDWAVASLALSDVTLPIIVRSGTYLPDQTTLDAVVARALTDGEPLVYLEIPPLGFTQSGHISNPSVYYPTPALMEQMLSQAAASAAASAADAAAAGGGGPAGGDLSGTFPSPSLIAVGTPGSTGDASHSLTLTTDAKGRVTAATPNVIAITESQVTNLVTDLAAKAPLVSPALTGTPTVPTASPLTNTTQAASTTYADAATAVEKTRGLAAESTLATNLGAEATRATTAEALLAPKASPTLTGTPVAPTAAAGTSTTQLATTAFAQTMTSPVLTTPALASPTNTATLGTDIIGASPSWTFTGSTVASGNGGQFVTGSGGSMYCTVTAPSAGPYYVSYTVSGATAGNLQLSCGADTNPSTPYGQSQIGTILVLATGSQTFTLTGDATYNGTITSITLQPMTRYAAVANLQSPAGTTRHDVRVTNNNGIGVGYGALGYCTSGSSNTALGSGVLYFNTTGFSNSAVGVNALYSNTTGGNNTALGFSALYANTTGTNNTALGYSALYANTTGTNNTALGSSVLRSNTTGTNNTALGYNALYAPGGLVANATSLSSNQTAIGYQSGLSVSDAAGGNNGITTIGYSALAGGSYATSLGYQAKAGAAGAVAIGTDNAGTGASTTTANVIAMGTALHQMQLKNNTTGAGSALLGSNSPAITNTAPYTWFKMMSSDGSTVYVPAWK